jgi:hypothetical protein
MNPKRINQLLWLVTAALAGACVAVGYVGVTAPLDRPLNDDTAVSVAIGEQPATDRAELPTLEELTSVGGLVLRRQLIEAPPVVAEPQPVAPVAPAPKLDLRLTGTVIESDRPYAILSDARGIARLVRVGDEIKEAKVLAITAESVTLTVQEQEVLLEVAPPNAPGSPGTPGSPGIRGSTRRQSR